MIKLSDLNFPKYLERISLASEVLLLIVLCIVLFPLIYLCLYVQPGAEDFAESLIINIPWHIKYLYLSYDGRYFAAFLYAINSVKQQLYLIYKIIPIALILAFLHSSYKLFSVLFSFPRRNYGILLALLFVLVYLAGVPEISYSLYYMISSYVYSLPIIMSMYLAYFSIQLFDVKTQTKRKLLHVISIALLIFFIVGTNEEYLIPLCAYIFGLVVINWKYKLKRGYEILLFSIVLLMSLFLVFSSPGTYEFIENEEASSRNLSYHWSALVNSYKNTLPVLLKWLKDYSFLWFFSIVLFGLSASKKIKLNYSLKFMPFIVFVTFMFLFIPVFTLPYFWANGSRSVDFYPQVFQICYFSLTTIILLTSIYLGHYLNSKSAFRIKTILILPLVLVPFTFSMLNSNNIKIAYTDLRSGNAKKYNQELVEVFHQLNHPSTENGEKQANICNLLHRPKTIFSGMFIKPSDDSWKLHYKMFFNLDDIKINTCE